MKSDKQHKRALKEIESEEWFLALDDETKKEAVEMHSDWIAPIGAVEHTLMNIAIDEAEKREEWSALREEKFPYLAGKNENQESLRLMRQFVGGFILGILNRKVGA